MSIVIELNPRVQEIIEAAIKEARCFWFGFTEHGVEVHSRLPVYLEPMDRPNAYTNTNLVLTDPTPCPQYVDGCVLSEYKVGPIIRSGPLTIPRQLRPGDQIGVQPGGLTVTGRLP